MCCAPARLHLISKKNLCGVGGSTSDSNWASTCPMMCDASAPSPGTYRRQHCPLYGTVRNAGSVTAMSLLSGCTSTEALAGRATRVTLTSELPASCRARVSRSRASPAFSTKMWKINFWRGWTSLSTGATARNLTGVRNSDVNCPRNRKYSMMAPTALMQNVEASASASDPNTLQPPGFSLQRRFCSSHVNTPSRITTSSCSN
eukprot:2864104-Rhodomonas_salina.4